MTTELELCWGTLAGTQLDELVAVAAPAGFAGVTATPAMARDGLARTGGGLVRSAESLGVQITRLDPLVSVLPGVPGADEVDESVRALFEIGLDECLDLAQRVGATSVNLAHFLGDPNVDPSALADAVAGICEAAGRSSISVTIEFFAESAVRDLPTAVRLVKAVGAPNLGIMLDTLHLIRTGGTADDVRALDRGAVTGLQVADRAEVPPDQPYVPMSGRALPGAGVLPLAPVVSAALDRGGPGLRAGIEVFDPDLRAAGPSQGARLAGAAMRHLLASLPG